jgi:hemerythrin superfamily protein
MKIIDDIKYSLLKESEPTSAIDLLKFDHRAVNAMFAACLKSEDPDEARQIMEQIIKELVAHAAAEEKLVYPILMKEDSEMAKEALEEHHIMKLSIAEIADLGGSEDHFKAKVKVLSEIVNTHVLEEESVMLPKVENSGADLKALADNIRAVKQQMKEGIKQIGNPMGNQIGGSPRQSKAS